MNWEKHVFGWTEKNMLQLGYCQIWHTQKKKCNEKAWSAALCTCTIHATSTTPTALDIPRGTWCSKSKFAIKVANAGTFFLVPWTAFSSSLRNRHWKQAPFFDLWAAKFVWTSASAPGVFILHLGFFIKKFQIGKTGKFRSPKKDFFNLRIIFS